MSGVLPPVERLRPGLWTIPVPLPNSSLRYVFVYLFETDEGAYIVDAGWNTNDAFDALSAGLAKAGYEMADVRGVMVTHIHPDHYGLAGRVKEASGAWISLHPSDAALIDSRYGRPDELMAEMGRLLARWGAPDDEAAELVSAAMPVRPLVDLVTPDVLLEDGDRPEVPGWDLSAIWTPGHSPGHLCFWEPTNRLLLAGDHVLPRITPNIPFHAQSGANPLSDFLRSLDKVGEYDADEVLPAHEYRFVDLQGRLTELRAHHQERFDEICEALDDGGATAWSLAGTLRWSRPWDQITGFMRRAAVAETMAHLRELEVRGVLVATDGEPAVWSRR
ncbi:MBL fold metallo-hydrolase [Ilumatobacter sp.]|uniref:MBL fold metallo-hydrolase n=1 Tax=Ilumatobacter sp. TaxID=1967498 RepID=UPI003B52804B